MSVKKRVCFIDVAEPGSLGAAYRFYGGMCRLAGLDVIGCRTIDDVYAGLDRYAEGGIETAQIVGHGYSGHPVIGLPKKNITHERIKAFSLFGSHPSWKACRGGSVRFSSCSVAQGQSGHTFMNRLAAEGVGVVAHLCVIGTWGVHSYLVGVHAGEKAWWSADTKPGDSVPWAPRTIPATQMSLPSWAFQRWRGVSG